MKEEEQDRLLVRDKNRDTFNAYVKNNVRDKIEQEMFYRSPVTDKTAFNSLTHRPKIPWDAMIKGLVALGTNSTFTTP